MHGLKSATPHNFTFDRILDSSVDQALTFEHVAERVCDDVLDGYNGCIFAYGQTGSGKTYTMFGPEGQNAHPEHMGIIPRSISYIFTEIEEDEEILEARIKVSFVEIYKERLRDLLNPSSKKPLTIRLGENGETRISNVTETHVLTLLDVLQLIEVANSFRTKAETSMNHSSSRSHMLMTLTVALRVEDGSIKVGKLNFCDLAGSEKVRKTNATGNRLKEAQQINLSLTILGQVISALAQNRKHVPFRDSKLTHVLKDSLGGNCKTTLIVNCSKHMFNREETINALRFGSRCKLITNNVSVNRIYSNAELLAMIEKLKRQNAKLTALLQNKGIVIDEEMLTSPKGSNKLFSKHKKSNGKGSADSDQNNAKLAQQVEELKQEVNRLNDKNHYLRMQCDKIEEKRHDTAEKVESAQRQIATLSARLTEYQSRTQQQQKDINRAEHEKQQLTLQLQSAQRMNEEYEAQIKDITKDRTYKTTKLNNQLDKFKLLHQDAMEETTELMDEVLNLKQSLEKSEALIDAQDHQLQEKRKDIDMLRRQAMEGETRVANILKEKISIQSQLTELRSSLGQYQETNSELEKQMERMQQEKDAQIESLRQELETRTQTLSTQNYELTQKLEQREMIQHAYSMRSPIGSPEIGKQNSAMLNAQISSSSSASYHAPKIVPALSTKASFQHLFASAATEEPSAELLIKSATLNNNDDVIAAEQSLLAQHDYLQKMATERLVERASTNRYTKRRSRVAQNDRVKLKDLKPEEEHKRMTTEIQGKETELEQLKTGNMPQEKEKRLKVLIKIASLQDEISTLKMKLQRKARNLAKKGKGGKNGNKEKDSEMIASVTTMDAMNYVDAALTLKQVQDANDDEDDDDDQTHVFVV